MCWSVPGKIINIEKDNRAVVEISGVRKEVSLDLMEDVAEGEYVLVHAGYAIQKVDKEKACFTIDFFKGGESDKVR